MVTFFIYTPTKAKLLLLKLIHLFAREVDIIKVGLVFSISNFFTTKTSMTNKWISNSALEGSQVIFLLSW